MKTIVLLMIGAATLFVTAGCEDEHHEHHEHSGGGTYGGNYHSYGYEHGPAYPARDGYWDSYGVWHPR